jgi:hypothetical protein
MKCRVRAIACLALSLSACGGGGAGDAPNSGGNSAPSGTGPAGAPSSEANDPIAPTAGPGGAAAPEPVATPTTSTKLDVLFVIDNSLGMGPKHELLADAVNDLFQQLLVPPVTDAHLGVITTSLGAYGAEHPCDDADAGQRDMAHLVGALRGNQPVIGWCSTGAQDACAGTNSVGAVASELADQVLAAGATGCGWEADLESWYRFLVEPAPYTEIVRQNCPVGGDTDLSCVGPATDASGAPLVDQELLQERAAFLRPDSVLLIVQLSDEDDCSWLPKGQTWRLAQTYETSAAGTVEYTSAFKGSAVCQTNPNDSCCVPCSNAAAPGCPTGTNAGGQTVPEGCEEPIYPSVNELASQGSAEPSLDNLNLRCFEQKQRFGVDYLYPVERYTNALTRTTICPSADDLDPASCADPAQVIENPLFAERAPKDVIIANLVGVPWQDLAVDPGASTLELHDASDLQWDWLIGERHPANGIVAPSDPLMLASVDPRSGVQPSTGVALQPSDAGPTAQPSNGHEWNILERDDLQNACVYELPEPLDCPPLEQAVEDGDAGCTCTFYADASYHNPSCQAPDGSFGFAQYSAAARPATRQLQLSFDVQSQAVVGSICAKQTSDRSAADYGYRPAFAAIARRVQQRFGP